MQVNSALREVGQIGMDRSGDAMHASELPFIMTAAVDDDDVPDLVAVAGRELDGCLVLDVAGWKIAIWQDLVAMAASCAVPRATYWPRDRSPEVALASVGDVCLMRLLQRYALHTLATRVGSAQPGTALKLQSAAHPIRSRLWWSGLSVTHSRRQSPIGWQRCGIFTSLPTRPSRVWRSWPDETRSTSPASSHKKPYYRPGKLRS